jgi:hypothetical protein
MEKKAALIVFSQTLPEEVKIFDIIVAPQALENAVRESGTDYRPLEAYIETESIYEASALAEDLSRLSLPNGTRLVKSFIYEGYEIWWGHYTNLFTRFCLPYTRYKKLFYFLKDFNRVHFHDAPLEKIFSCFFSAYGIEYESNSKSLTGSRLSFGILIQILLSLLYIPMLILHKRSILLSTGDKLEPSRDFDFRMRFIYEELRKRNLPFSEFVRSLESSKTILNHAWVRRRPVLYTEAIVFIGRFISYISGGRRKANRLYNPQTFASVADKELRFRLEVATQYMLNVQDDVASIRILKWLIPKFGIKSAIIPATTERNFHTVLACKLNGIPIVGILHGAASRHYNVYEFMPAFDGEKRMTVDKYGVWSQWWKKYFETYSKAYAPEQIIVSGHMRPVQKKSVERTEFSKGRIKVLFVSEVVAIPLEVMPYLDALLDTQEFDVFIKFRATHDNFEMWLKENRPDILFKIDSDHLLKGTMHEAIEASFVFFNTRKWGDYFDMKLFSNEYKFFAEDVESFLSCIRQGIDIPVEVLRKLRERFFGDPYRNGSSWVIDQIEEHIKA